jgi:hypothetical protein
VINVGENLVNEKMIQNLFEGSREGERAKSSIFCTNI